ncbi:uncharacterized protein LOC131435783 [Malaya genurostris]|uniref:uncharacterized protein LOC131435783 n=1 Tax=Malaya genurostris TaxID=325434 RepID=UPI0026F3825A|nr:uncharacterized protein LOC131435783 [Malaya genurostris]
MRAKDLIIPLLVFLGTFEKGTAIWCYRCTSATPGCGDKFNWRGIGYLGDPCPEDDDICVKVIERKGTTETITRDCLSALQGFRTDIPADKYEGCYKSAKDEQLAHYVNNSIKQLDVRRDYYTSTTFCFCFLDHRCNKAPGRQSLVWMMGASVLAGLFFALRWKML